MFKALLLFSFLSFSFSSFASPSCDDYYAKAAAKLTDFITQKITEVFKQKGIAIDATKLNVTVSTNDVEDEGVDYYSPVIDGRFTTASGTEFYIFASSDSQYVPGGGPEYVAVLKTSGFDKEGNPIQPHCFLHYASPFTNSTSYITVENLKSGVDLATFQLPLNFQAY